MFHRAGQPGQWTSRSIALRDADDQPLWIEHPGGREVDIAALRLPANDPDVTAYPLDLSLSWVDIVADPGMPVFVIGYPEGLTNAGNWPIWKTGHIASDPDLDYDGKPSFLIDATTRSGMSGSPVILRPGSYTTLGGGVAIAAGGTKFLGVYSGRILPDVEIGRVWRAHVVLELMESWLQDESGGGP